MLPVVVLVVLYGVVQCDVYRSLRRTADESSVTEEP